MNDIKDLDIAISMFTHATDQVVSDYSRFEVLINEMENYLDYLLTSKRSNYKYPIGAFIKVKADNGKICTAQIIQHGSLEYNKKRPAYVVKYLKSRTINKQIVERFIIGLDTVAYMKYKKKE